MTRLFAQIDGQIPATLVDLKATPEGYLITSPLGQEGGGSTGSAPASALKFSKSEVVGDTTYVLKTSPAVWLLIKLVATATGDEATYASAANNAFITSETAWDERATLFYAAP